MPLKIPLNLKITYVLFLSHFDHPDPKNNVPERFPILPQFWRSQKWLKNESHFWSSPDQGHLPAIKKDRPASSKCPQNEDFWGPGQKSTFWPILGQNNVPSRELIKCPCFDHVSKCARVGHISKPPGQEIGQISSKIWPYDQIWPEPTLSSHENYT